jgi:hypothetical protein
MKTREKIFRTTDGCGMDVVDVDTYCSGGGMDVEGWMWTPRWMVDVDTQGMDVEDGCGHPGGWWMWTPRGWMWTPTVRIRTF